MAILTGVCSGISPDCRAVRVAHQLRLRCCRGRPPLADPDAGVWVIIPVDTLVAKSTDDNAKIELRLDVPMPFSKTNLTRLPGAPHCSSKTGQEGEPSPLPSEDNTQHTHFGTHLRVQLQWEHTLADELQSILIDSLDQVAEVVRVIRQQAAYNWLFDSCAEPEANQPAPAGADQGSLHALEVVAYEDTFHVTYVDPATGKLAKARVDLSGTAGTLDDPQPFAVTADVGNSSCTKDLGMLLGRSLSLPVAFCHALSEAQRKAQTG